MWSIIERQQLLIRALNSILIKEAQETSARRKPAEIPGPRFCGAKTPLSACNVSGKARHDPPLGDQNSTSISNIFSFLLFPFSSSIRLFELSGSRVPTRPELGRIPRRHLYIRAVTKPYETAQRPERPSSPWGAASPAFPPSLQPTRVHMTRRCLLSQLTSHHSLTLTSADPPPPRPCRRHTSRRRSS